MKQLFLGFFILALSACSTTRKIGKDGAPTYYSNTPNTTVKAEPRSKYGNPECYAVNGQTYQVMKSAQGYCKKGVASWYGTKFHGKKTSSLEPYDMFGMTAASTSLPIPTYVEVTNLENGKKIIVKVNDRGPFKSDRIIDLSYAAASKLGFANSGTANVEVRALDPGTAPKGDTSQAVILASNKKFDEIEINPISLPSPTAAPVTVTLERNLQVGAFSLHENAQRLQKEIKLYTDAPVIIKEGVSNDKPIYRVQVGPFKNASESDNILNTLHEHGIKVITVFS